MSYFVIEPEVAGELGERTVFGTRSHPPKIEKLEYYFQGWLGDCILESFPCYIVTEDCARAVLSVKLTGMSFDDVMVTVSENFEEFHPGMTLPKFRWLKVNGTAGKEDFGVDQSLRLVVSDKALEVMRPFGIEHADLEPYIK